MTEVNVTPPVVSGTARQGQTLHTSNGTWTFDLDYLTYEYQWERCDAGGANCVDIANATNSSYTLTSADVGHTIRCEVTATEHTAPSGGLSSPYFDFPFVNISNPAFDFIQTSTMRSGQGPGVGNGFQDLSQSGAVTSSTPDGRVAIVAAPDAIGSALRFELRDSDGPWPPDTTGTRSQLQMSDTQTWNGVPFSVGTIRYFLYELYLPNNDPVGEYFDWARNNWNTWLGLHPSDGNTSGQGWGCFDMGTDGPYGHPFYMTWKLAGGRGVNPADTLIYPRLFQLTNADGTRYAPNYNRRIQVIVGGKFDPTHAGGWFEAWVDGVNVVPRFSHATMWTGDTSTYFKCGPYHKASDTFPTNGKSVMYFTKIQFGTTL